MKSIESFSNKAFVISSIYLLVVILVGFFVIPSILQVDDYNFPFVVELFLKVTSTIATVLVLSSAITMLVLKLIRRPTRGLNSPAFIAAVTLFVGLIVIFIHALYVKLRTCPVDGSNAWYCQVEGKSYVGMLVLAFFLASLVGCVAWASQRLAAKK